MAAAIARAALEQIEVPAVRSPAPVARVAEVDILFLRCIELQDCLAHRRMKKITLREKPRQDHEEQPFAVRAQIEPAFGQKEFKPLEIFACRRFAEIVDETVRQETAGAKQGANSLPPVIIVVA